MMMSSNTNQYKDLIAQREFSGPEARSLIAPRLWHPAPPYLLYPYSRALMTFTTSMWFATSEEHSETRVKLPLCL